MLPVRPTLPILTLGLLVAWSTPSASKIVHHTVNYTGSVADGNVAFDFTDGSVIPGSPPTIPDTGILLLSCCNGAGHTIQINANPGGGPVITDLSTFAAEKYSIGSVIDGSIPDADSGLPGFHEFGRIRGSSGMNFADGERGFVGLRLNDGAFYGWAEVSAIQFESWTVYQFAYEDTGAPIKIGDTGTPEWIGFWDGPAVSTPIEWEAMTSLEGRFVYGTDTGELPMTFGGSATHTHTVDAPSTQTSNNNTGDNARRNLTTGLQVADSPHRHTVNIPPVESGTGSTLPDLVQKLVFLRGDAAAGAPGGLIALWSGAVAEIPSGWALCDGVNSAFDLSDRFVMATGPGEDPQPVDNGLHSHAVDLPLAQTTSSGPNNTVPRRGLNTQQAAHPNHTHQFWIPEFASATEEILPPFQELAFIIRQGLPAEVPAGVIMMWGGDPALLPSGWVLCDGTNSTPDLRNRFVRGTFGGEEPGATGGSPDHSHSVDPPFRNSTFPSASAAQGLGSTNIAGDAHGHSLDIPAFDSAPASSLPPYVKLAFVMSLGTVVSAPEDGALASGRGLILHAPHPNPVDAVTTFRFDVARRSHVELVIYDTAGRRVRSLTSSPREAGSHQLRWDGRSDAGTSVAAGIYFARLAAGGTEHTRKLAVVR